MGKPFEIDETKYSSFKKLLRVTAYVNRFINHIKNKREIDKELTANEMSRADTSKGSIIFQMNNNSTKNRQSQLNPKLHQDGIIRLHGRFVNADLQESAKLPILLPR